MQTQFRRFYTIGVPWFFAVLGVKLYMEATACNTAAAALVDVSAGQQKKTAESGLAQSLQGGVLP